MLRMSATCQLEGTQWLSCCPCASWQTHSSRSFVHVPLWAAALERRGLPAAAGDMEFPEPGTQWLLLVCQPHPACLSLPRVAPFEDCVRKLSQGGWRSLSSPSPADSALPYPRECLIPVGTQASGWRQGRLQELKDCILILPQPCSQCGGSPGYPALTGPACVCPGGPAGWRVHGQITPSPFHPGHPRQPTLCLPFSSTCWPGSLGARGARAFPRAGSAL